MFNGGSSVNLDKYFGWLERIIDIIVRLFDSLGGGSSATTSTTEPAASTTEPQD